MPPSSVTALAPESIRVAVVAGHANNAIFDYAVTREETISGAPASCIAATRLGSLCLSGTAVLLHETVPSVRQSVFVVGGKPNSARPSVVSTPLTAMPTVAGSPSAPAGRVPSTILCMSIEFAHTLPPNKYNYAVAFVLQFPGDHAHDEAASVALSHWTANSRHLRLHVARIASAVAERLEEVARTSKGFRHGAPKSLGATVAVNVAVQRAIESVWVLSGSGSRHTFGNVPLLAACAPATTGAGLQSFQTRVAAIEESRAEERLRQQQDEMHMSAMSPLMGKAAYFAASSGSTPPSRRDAAARAGGSDSNTSNDGKLPSGPPPSKTAPSRFEVAAQGAVSFETREQALRTLYTYCPHGLSLLVTAALALSHPDSLASPVAFGGSGLALTLHAMDVPELCGYRTTPTAPQATLPLTAPNDLRALVGTIAKICRNRDLFADRARARLVIVTSDPDIGRCALTVGAMLFRPDTLSSDVHRALYNPEVWGLGGDPTVGGSPLRPPSATTARQLLVDSDDDIDGTASRLKELESVFDDDPRDALSATPCVYASFACGCDRVESHISPVDPTAEEPAFPWSPVLWVASDELTPAEEAVLVSGAEYDTVVMCRMTAESAAAGASCSTTKSTHSGAASAREMQGGGSGASVRFANTQPNFRFEGQNSSFSDPNTPVPHQSRGEILRVDTQRAMDPLTTVGIVPKAIRIQSDAVVSDRAPFDASPAVTAHLDGCLGGGRTGCGGGKVGEGGGGARDHAPYRGEPALQSRSHSSPTILLGASPAGGHHPTAQDASAFAVPLSRFVDHLALVDSFRFVLHQRATALMGIAISAGLPMQRTTPGSSYLGGGPPGGPASGARSPLLGPKRGTPSNKSFSTAPPEAVPEAVVPPIFAPIPADCVARVTGSSTEPTPPSSAGKAGGGVHHRRARSFGATDAASTRSSPEQRSPAAPGGANTWRSDYSIGDVVLASLVLHDDSALRLYTAASSDDPDSGHTVTACSMPTSSGKPRSL